jgi:tetratricopeptide (TPR) repeat protein
MWGSLASIYQNLIGIAADAPSWAIAAYQKAITLDPVNPVLRLDLGGVYVGIKDYDNALQQFMTAVALKPNYANGYYNLANVFKLKGNTKEAKAALQNVLDLLPNTSSEYQKVMEELNAFDTQTIPSPPVVPTNSVIIPELTIPQ